MAKAKRQGGRAKLARSETVTVRLDPKLRYLAELAALKQRRTLSSYIEWAVEDSLNRVVLRDRGNDTITVADEAERLWDVDEADRFAKLALRYPELLNHDAAKLWKVIRACSGLWRVRWNGDGTCSWTLDEQHLIFALVREHWVLLVAVARGEAKESELLQAIPPAKPDDDIPF